MIRKLGIQRRNTKSVIIQIYSGEKKTKIFSNIHSFSQHFQRPNWSYLDVKRRAVLATLCSQSRVEIQWGDLKHQFTKNQTTSKECQKLRENFFIAKNNIFADYKFLKIFFKNRFALVCGKFIYVYFETNRQLSSVRRFTFYSKITYK